MGKQLSFIVDFAIKISIYRGFPIALSDCQRVKNDFLRGKMENQPSECRSIISVPMTYRLDMVNIPWQTVSLPGGISHY